MSSHSTLAIKLRVLLILGKVRRLDTILPQNQVSIECSKRKAIIASIVNCEQQGHKQIGDRFYCLFGVLFELFCFVFFVCLFVCLYLFLCVCVFFHCRYICVIHVFTDAFKERLNDFGGKTGTQTDTTSQNK